MEYFHSELVHSYLSCLDFQVDLNISLSYPQHWEYTSWVVDTRFLYNIHVQTLQNECKCILHHTQCGYYYQMQTCHWEVVYQSGLLMLHVLGLDLDRCLRKYTQHVYSGYDLGLILCYFTKGVLIEYN